VPYTRDLFNNPQHLIGPDGAVRVGNRDLLTGKRIRKIHDVSLLPLTSCLASRNMFPRLRQFGPSGRLHHQIALVHCFRRHP